MDSISKGILKLSAVDTERLYSSVLFSSRENCYDIGLTEDLCVWFTQCYNYLCDISKCTSSINSFTFSRSVLHIR